MSHDGRDDDLGLAGSNRGWWLLLAGGLAVFALIAWGITRAFAPPEAPSATEAPVTAPATGTDETAAHISATLFFGSPDGQSLVPQQREVALGGSVVEQGQRILVAQLQAEPAAPFVSVIPSGTTLRAFYVTDIGDAFVDLSPEIVNGHPGGSQHELLTVYALVNAVTANLPAARRVQILVDGMEVDTIAGHVDLRSPLTPDPSLVSRN
jgi:hypothetical protein